MPGDPRTPASVDATVPTGKGGRTFVLTTIAVPGTLPPGVPSSLSVWFGPGGHEAVAIDSSSAIACSAVDRLLVPGALATIIPRRVAASSKHGRSSWTRL